MNKIKKISIVFVCLTVMIAVFAVASLDNSTVNAIVGPTSSTLSGVTYLNQIAQVPIDPADFRQTGCETGPEIPEIGGPADVFWHFIDTTASDLTAFVEFTNGSGTIINVTLNAYKLVGAGHYGVYTPFGYKLTNAYLNGLIDGNFNLSHTCYETQETTTVLESTVTETTDPRETTVTETTTEATTSETLTTLTTESIPLTSVTTTEPVESTVTETTTETYITLTTESIPKTGETGRAGSGNGLLIGLILLAAAGALTYIIYRRKPAQNEG